MTSKFKYLFIPLLALISVVVPVHADQANGKVTSDIAAFLYGGTVSTPGASGLRASIRASSTLRSLSTRGKGDYQPVMASPPTITEATTSGMAADSLRWAPGTTTSLVNKNNYSNEFFTLTRGALTGNLNTATTFNNVTVTNTPTYLGCSFGCHFFHTGSKFQFMLGGSGTSFLLKIDGEYVSLTPTAISSGGGLKYFLVDLGTVARRRVEFIGYNITFYDVRTDKTDTITAAPVRGPRMIVLGDSFTATQPNGFTTAMADALGWDDVWASGVGGTGYFATNSGVAPTFRQRVAHDVISYNPDIVFVYGSINDAGNAGIATEAGLLYDQILTALPRCLLIAGVNQSGGVSTLSTAAIAYKNAIKSAVESRGGLFLDTLELPVLPAGSTLVSGVLKSATIVNQTGSTGFRSDKPLKLQGTYDIGGTERVLVRSVTQIDGTTWNMTFDGFVKYAHASGSTVQEIGGSWMTGVGNTGSTTGVGNSDLYLSSDGVHSSPSGYQMLGYVLADLLKSKIDP